MKKYYCLIVIGNIEMLEETLNSKIIAGTFMHKNFGKIFISTFESDLSIWEIEEILHGEKRSYFLTKMEGHNFTATVQDMNIQNDLFSDYVTKMVKKNDENINLPLDFNDINPFNFDQKIPSDFNEKINNFLDSIKNNNFNNKSLKSRKKSKKVELIPPTLDEILDKINKVGYQKLSKFEKECLEKYSKNQ